ncbi:hypothetical protein D8B26_005366 [Coccidioides posadasii str. Silveira]|uniref:Uncharacterized protein n=1 Tax=Coccidioides posadasii (strain RMSCC 757 / Silveira) TaxID=443226 RepID=E9D535_COCPS|nr:conserved hypothetical protein [Coccidioides posadasii str. Silveira]QVM10713.1 hypothetical protein D8B26_005366 [Coccidioides posadasii str. Silveira]
MSEEAAALRRLLEEEKRLREEETKLREEEKKRRLDAEQRLHATQEELQSTAQNLQEEREQRKLQEELQQKTTIFEFLDACHTHLFLGLTVRHPKDSTKGDLANPVGRLRPEKIRKWLGFGAEQEEIWQGLMDSNFVQNRHFKSLSLLAESGAELRTEKTGSELDLRQFRHETLTRPVRSVIAKLYSDERIRQRFQLLGAITFENHGNTLTEESLEAAPSGEPSRPAKFRKTGTGDATPASTPQSSRSLADEFCVYNKGDGQNVPVYIVELKAPHKLPQSTIESTLQEMDLDEVIVHRPDEPNEVACRREMAAVITQAFSYMVKSGVGYRYVCTGEAFIFLHVGLDPSTVFYYLSTPKNDVGDTNGYTDRTDQPNRLHLTAVGQVLAFTLRALQAKPYPQSWRDGAESRLKRWCLVYQDETILSSPQTVSTQDYTPERESRDDYLKRSPIVTRAKKAPLFRPSSPCNPPQASRSPANSSDEDTSGPTGSLSKAPRRSANVMVVVPARSSKTSSERNSTSQIRSRPYCTQRCLLGLSKGGPLDQDCPNVADHGTDKHPIGLSEFVSLLHKRLSYQDNRRYGAYESAGCESLHIHGSRGALFEVVLIQYGYKLVGKGFPANFTQYLQQEEAVYKRLLPIQGRHVPVCLGVLDLSQRQLFYDGIARIPHLLLLSHAGLPLHRSDIDHERLFRAAEESLQAIHKLGVRHCDAYTHNMFWNPENEKVIFIDFERAEIQDLGFLFKTTSLERRWKERDTTKQARTAGMLSYEMQRMRFDLECELTYLS